MVETVAVAILGDVAVDQPDFVAIDRRVALRDRPLAVTQRFHFGPGKLDARLESLFDEIVEARSPVFGHDLLLVEGLRERLCHGRLRSAPHARARRRRRIWRLPM